VSPVSAIKADDVLPSAHETEKQGLADSTAFSPSRGKMVRDSSLLGWRLLDYVRGPLAPPRLSRLSCRRPQAATGTPSSPMFSISRFEALTMKRADSIATTKKAAPIANPIT
jgi:hypothetical protein